MFLASSLQATEVMFIMLTSVRMLSSLGVKFENNNKKKQTRLKASIIFHV